MSSLAEMLLSRLKNEGSLESLSRSLGSDPETTRSATAAALPMLLAALAKNASTDEGAAALAGALDRDHDGSVLDRLQGGLPDDLGADGDGILRHALGDRRGTAEVGLARASGLERHQISTMLATLAPLVMGVLGQAKRSRGLDASALADLLRGEGDRARSRLGGLAGLLDRDGDGGIADDLLGGLGRSLFGGKG